MSELSFEELLKEEESVRIHNGSVVTGKVIYVKENEIALNIGYKHDGIVTKSEYSDDPNVNLLEAVHVGDEMDVKVLKVNDGEGQVALSFKKVSQERSIKALEEAFEAKTPLTGTVTEVIKGGLSVDCQGATVFIPASLVSDFFERNLKKYTDKEIEFVLIEYNPRKHRIVGDRKQLIEAEKAAARKALLERVDVGMIVSGKIKNLTDFGAFIDLDGADGLLHISEMSFGRIDNPKKLFKVGDEVEAFIKEIKDDKIALSIQFPEKNPWVADGPYSLGNIVKGKVARVLDYGAFIELEPGIDGLLHVSQISYERVEKPADVLKVGDEIEAKVVECDLENRKISLSIKALLPEPEVKEEEAEAPAEETPVEAPAEAPVEEAPVEAPEAEAEVANAEENTEE